MRRFSALPIGAGASSQRKQGNGKVQTGSKQEDRKNDAASEAMTAGVGPSSGCAAASLLPAVGRQVNVAPVSSSKCHSQRAKVQRSAVSALYSSRGDGREEVGASLKRDTVQGASLNELFPRVDRPLRLDQEVARRSKEDEKYVYPWVVVVVNVDLARWQLNGDPWSLMHAKLEALFSSFNLRDVKVFEGVELPHITGVVALMFDRDLNGFCDAHALEVRFLQSGRGRKDWDRKKLPRGNPGKDLYGWIGRQEDYYSDTPLGKFLFDYGELKTVATVGEDKMNKYSQRFQHTVDATVDKYMHQVECMESEVGVKNKELLALDKRVEGLQKAVAVAEKTRKRLEDDQLQMAAMRKSDVENLNTELKKLQDECTHLKLERANMSTGFDKKCIEMEQAKGVELEAERKKQDTGQREMQRRMHVLSETHKKAYTNLIRKHERDLKVLQELQKKNLWELSQHKAEIEKLRLLVRKQKNGERELRSDNIGKFSRGQELYKSGCTAAKHGPLDSTTVKREMSGSQSAQGTEELEKDPGLHKLRFNTLVRKEREMREELEQSTRMAVQVLEKHGSKEKIGVKRMGDIDSGPWKVACKRKYKDGWEAHFLRIFAEWEQRVRDSEWHPFKVVPVGDDDEWKEVVDQDDKKLLLLRQELGKAVCKTVTNAIGELEEFNAIGRYPVPIAFNFGQYRRANLNEVLLYLDELLDTGNIAKRRKRQRQEMS